MLIMNENILFSAILQQILYPLSEWECSLRYEVYAINQVHAVLNILYHLLMDPTARDLGMQYDLHGIEMGITTLSYCHLFLCFFGHS